MQNEEVSPKARRVEIPKYTCTWCGRVGPAKFRLVSLKANSPKPNEAWPGKLLWECNDRDMCMVRRAKKQRVFDEYLAQMRILESERMEANLIKRARKLLSQ